MSTRRNTATNNLFRLRIPSHKTRSPRPKLLFSFLVDTSNKREKKTVPCQDLKHFTNIEQHLLGLATRAIKPALDLVDPDFLTLECLLTSTSNSTPLRPQRPGLLRSTSTSPPTHQNLPQTH
ncbi:hypothetical protein PSHT_16185 [Puccinia striiformis]|uniref:Uncharacterized protein n=1 Tax=Puccinia striiformis TaxID=27350 RepID=A0A2S4UB51_9BASI|nr:hypothetical protein PSHT_16185 [Puccinia striiformis]